MKRTINYHIWPRDLDFAEKLPTVIESAKLRGYTESKFELHQVAFDNYEEASTDNFEEFVSLIRKRPRFSSFASMLEISDPVKNEIIKYNISFSKYAFNISISVSNDDIGVSIHNLLREEFELRNPPALEAENGRPKNLHATVFLGRHFDDEGREAGSTVREFISLLRFEVKEADKYRSMSIPEKVKSLIKIQDIYIGLVTGDRDHGWIIAESSYAAALNKHIILIIEEGADFKPTLEGHDFEQIRFPKGHVEKCFIKLMSEFRSLGILGL